MIHDGDTDPVAGRTELTEGVRLVAAGEPEWCSGKANATAAGMEAACHDRLIWTDGDFHHPADWLETLKTAYERHGPVSEVPYFVERDPLAVLIEPMLASSGSLGIYLLDQIWGGAVTFERDDIDDAAFLDELRRTVSDDALVMEHLEVTTVRRTHLVPAGGTVRQTIERVVRWTKIIRRNEVLGVRRWTALLAYPSVFAFVPLVPYALARRTFVWGDRRYRWRSKFDVEIIE